MSIVPDQITLKRLALIKQLYQRGLILSNSYSNSDKMMSVIILDFSIETMLNTIVASLDNTKNPAGNFVGLLNQVDDIFKEKQLGLLPNRGNILRVHEIRKNAQHDAIYPSNPDLSDCQTYTKDFHRTICNLIWNSDFDKISLVDLIQNSKVKEHITNAQDALNNRDYKDTATKSTIALHSALDMVGLAIVGSKQQVFQKNIMVEGSFGRNPEPDEHLTRAIRRIQQTLQFVALGLNFSDYMKFRQIAGYTLFDATHIPIVQGTKEDLSPEEAEFVVAFAIDSVISIENIVGDLEKPFGRDKIGWLFGS